MPEQYKFRKADEVSDEEVVDHWDKAATEFSSFFGEGEEFYHKHIINPSVLDLVGDVGGLTIIGVSKPLFNGGNAKGGCNAKNARFYYLRTFPIGYLWSECPIAARKPNRLLGQCGASNTSDSRKWQ